MTRTIHTFASCLLVGDTIVDIYDHQCRVDDICGDDSSMLISFGAKYNGVWAKEFRGIDCVRMLIPEKVEETPNRIQTMSKHDRVFDSTSRMWQKSPELNAIFLKCQQTYANDLLHTRGHVFLNEVYDALGFERSAPGALMGWITPSIGAISFGDLEAQRDQKHVVLNFNVQGTVFDTLPGDWEMP